MFLFGLKWNLLYDMCLKYVLFHPFQCFKKSVQATFHSSVHQWSIIRCGLNVCCDGYDMNGLLMKANLIITGKIDNLFNGCLSLL